MKVGVLIPTRGDRPQFLQFAHRQLANQTHQPDEVLVVDHAPSGDKPDITHRYRTGCAQLQGKVDVILFWEDDDYYDRNYISRMVQYAQANPHAEIWGASSTIYYNIVTRKWAEFKHAGRASMFHTGVRTRALAGMKWCADDYSYTDLHLWRTLKGSAFSVQHPWAVGIKHGMGLCGGGGHQKDWRAYTNQDPDYQQLRIFASDEAVNYYTSMTTEIQRYSFKAKGLPLVSIITRVMPNKRPKLFAQHKASIAALTSTDYEQVFIIDRIGHGMLAANRSFAQANPFGKYVYLLDDDDYLTRPDFIQLVASAKTEGGNDPDVIFFKNKILTGDGDQLYPKPQSWQTRQPKRGQIGGSCFVVKRWVFDLYIHHFGHPSFGDWHFITRVLADDAVRCVWVDELIMQTGKVSRGAAE